MQYRTGCAQKQNQNYEQKILSILRHFYCNRCFLWPFHSYVNQVTPMKIKYSQQGSRNKIHDTLRKPLRQICWFFLTTCTYYKGSLPTTKLRHNAKLVLFELHHAQRQRDIYKQLEGNLQVDIAGYEIFFLEKFCYARTRCMKVVQVL